jgi:putative CocE/NonD family hydrolase
MIRTRGYAVVPLRSHRRGVNRGITVTAADGVDLLVDHYWPKPKADVAAASVGAVVVWIRTPYGRKQVAPIAKRFSKRGSHVIVEAQRGTDGSAGSFEGIRLNPTDGADVAAWMRGQSWFPGRIVTWGHSGIGYASWALASQEIPEWELAILHDTQSEARSVVFPGGVFASVMLGFIHAVAWLEQHPRASRARGLLAEFRAGRRIGKVLATQPLGTADEHLVGHRVDYFRDWLNYRDDSAYWRHLDLRPNAARMPEQVHLATGWYDTGLPSTLLDYAALRAAGRSVRLLIGPWYHGAGFMDKNYKNEVNTCVGKLVRGDRAVDRSSVRIHVSGVDQWRDLVDWPPPDVTSVTWHLQPGGGLDTTPAPDSEPDRYRYDPTDPTPSVGGAKENWDGNAGAKDNSKLERRPDVLTYTSEPLAGDTDVIGPVTADIVMRSSRANTDLFARLCDVDPKGRSVNLCDGIRRLEPSDPAKAGDGTRRVHVDLVATAHRFRRGHRIRLQLSSGAHPRYVLNPGTDAPLSGATEPQPADQEILHDPHHPSTVTLPVC